MIELCHTQNVHSTRDENTTRKWFFYFFCIFSEQKEKQQIILNSKMQQSFGHIINVKMQEKYEYHESNFVCVRLIQHIHITSVFEQYICHSTVKNHCFQYDG